MTEPDAKSAPSVTTRTAIDANLPLPVNACNARLDSPDLKALELVSLAPRVALSASLPTTV
jgi:hypothetical protein